MDLGADTGITGGTLRVTEGERVLKVVRAKDGRRRIVLPRLRPGRHRLVVTFTGSGTVDTAAERIVVRVRRR